MPAITLFDTGTDGTLHSAWGDWRCTRIVARALSRPNRDFFRYRVRSRSEIIRAPVQDWHAQEQYRENGSSMLSNAKQTREGRIVSVVNENLCKGCGLCVAACRLGAANLCNFTQS